MSNLTDSEVSLLADERVRLPVWNSGLIDNSDDEPYRSKTLHKASGESAKGCFEPMIFMRRDPPVWTGGEVLFSGSILKFSREG